MRNIIILIIIIINLVMILGSFYFMVIFPQIIWVVLPCDIILLFFMILFYKSIDHKVNNSDILDNEF